MEIHAFDWRYDPQKAIEGVQHLILKKCPSIADVCGKTFSPIRNFVSRHRVQITTLLPSDLSPDTHYLITPSELHPFIP